MATPQHGRMEAIQFDDDLFAYAAKRRRAAHC
jgi:hypothetical protein